MRKITRKLKKDTVEIIKASMDIDTFVSLATVTSAVSESPEPIVDNE